jgi:hypothetical protein
MQLLQEARPCGRGVLEETARSTAVQNRLFGIRQTVSDRGRIHRILVILNGIYNQDIFWSVRQYGAADCQEMQLLQEARPCGRGVLEETARSTADRGRIHRILVILNGIYNQDIFWSDLRQQDRDVLQAASGPSVNTVQQTAKKCNYCKKRGHVVAECWTWKSAGPADLPPGLMVYFANCFLVSRKHSVQPSGVRRKDSPIPLQAASGPSVNTVQQTAKKCNYCKKQSGHILVRSASARSRCVLDRRSIRARWHSIDVPAELFAQLRETTGERCGSAREFVDRVRLLVHRLNAMVLVNLSSEPSVRH